MPIQRAFHKNVAVKKIIKEPIELDDIGMINVHLDFQFSDKLPEHVILPNDSFCHDFNGTYHASRFLYC